jgi:hypothetical protein
MSKQLICLSVKLTPEEYEVLAMLIAMASSDPFDVNYKELESLRLKVKEARDNELIHKSLNGHPRVDDKKLCESEYMELRRIAGARRLK